MNLDADADAGDEVVVVGLGGTAPPGRPGITTAGARAPHLTAAFDRCS
jgi:hypothetical protein